MKQIIKYTEKKEYFVQVTINEARNLKPSTSSGLANPFAQVTVADLPPQATDTEWETVSASWNQTFSFANLVLSEYDIQKLEITIEVISKNQYLSNELIGSCSIGIGTLYNKMNHELYNVWLPVSHPTNKHDTTGYILVSCFVLGPGDQPPSHNVNEMPLEHELDDLQDKDENEMTIEELKRFKNRGKNIAILGEPDLTLKGYQLNVNIVRAQYLAVLGMDQPDAFLSVRVGNTVLKTGVGTSTTKPYFNSRLIFPIFFPVINDKIVIRVWDKRLLASDIFIANIPENPLIDNFFSVNYLQSVGGNIAFRWVNLYSIPKDERPSGFDNLKQLFTGKKIFTEGTQFMGRVLLSMNLIPHEKPQKGVTGLNGFNEPDECDYTLLADVYEFQEFAPVGDMVMVEIGFGGCKPVESAWVEKDEPENDDEDVTKFEWKGKNYQIPLLVEKYPIDRHQVPDIIISLYVNTFMGGKKRIGYLRVSATSEDLNDNTPKWYRLKNPLNNFDGESPGYLLINLNLIVGRKDKMTRQVKARSNQKDKVVLIVFLYGGYDLAPEEFFTDISANVRVQIGKHTKNFKGTTETRFPIFEENFYAEEIDLDQKLEFAPNLQVTCFNEKYGGSNDKNFNKLHNRGFIGEFVIPAKAIQVISDPDEFKVDIKFFTFEKNGITTGRILGQFVLAKSQAKKQDHRNRYKTAFDEIVVPQNVNIKIGVFGARNLDVALKNPMIKIKMPGYYNGEIKPSSFLSNFQTETITPIKQRNPDFFSIEILNDVANQFRINHVLMPFIEIEIYDKDDEKNVSKKFFASVSALQFMNWIIPQNIKEAFEKFSEEPDAFNPSSATKSTKSKGSSHKSSKNKSATQKDGKGKNAGEKVLADIEEEKEMENEEEYSGNVFNNPDADKIDMVNNMAEDNEEENNGEGQQIIQENVYYMATDPLFKSNDAFMVVAEDNIAGMPTPFSGFEFDCEKEFKIKEAQERKNKRLKLLEEVKFIKSLPKYNEEDIIEKSKKIKKMTRSFVTEQKFMGYIVDELEFNYGRDIIKGSYSDVIEKNLPYSRIKLYRHKTFWDGFQKSRTVEGIRVIAGIPTNASIKVAFLIEKKENEMANLKKNITFRVSNQLNQKSNDKDDSNNEFKFDPYQEYVMHQIASIKSLKVRIYLFRAINLKGITNVAGIQHRLAGVTALSSANPYPVIEVGTGINDPQNGILKKFSDTLNVRDQTLNPKFFTNYEMDATLPCDWCLKIHIYSSSLIGKLTQNMANTYMGTSSIDIEDRFYGNRTRLRTVGLQGWKKYYENLSRKAESKDKKSLNDSKIRAINFLLAEKAKEEESPVEYNYLSQGHKLNKVGNIEGIIDVLTEDEARQKALSIFEPPKDKEYEIRLVIWEAFDVALGNKKAIDLYVKATLDPNGWQTTSISKETDTHLGCTDGYAIWNWRMVFRIKMPCDFPRIGLTLMDFEALGSDDFVGQAMISLKRVLRVVEKEGKYELLPSKIPLFSSKQKGKRGDLVVSIKIISIEEANANPVGEAQKEPNQDPHLTAPTLGRNLGDFFKGFSFNFIPFGLISRYLKIFAVLIIVILVIVILFIKPGILIA